MPKILLINILFFTLLLNHKNIAFNSNANFHNDECINGAALKIINHINQKQENHYILGIESFGCLIYEENTLNSAQYKYNMKIEWKNSYLFMDRSYWLKGVLIMDQNCCNINWKSQSYSTGLEQYLIPTHLGCISREDIYKGMGVGKPPKRKSYRRN